VRHIKSVRDKRPLAATHQIRQGQKAIGCKPAGKVKYLCVLWHKHIKCTMEPFLFNAAWPYIYKPFNLAHSALLFMFAIMNNLTMVYLQSQSNKYIQQIAWILQATVELMHTVHADGVFLRILQFVSSNYCFILQFLQSQCRKACWEELGSPVWFWRKR